MSNWFGKLFGFCRKQIPQQIQRTKAVQNIGQKVETKVKPIAKQATQPYSSSLGSELSYGKWYYGVDEKAEPIVKRFTGGIEKRYPCKDGGELVVNYVSRVDKSSRLDITKVGNPNDINKGDWYRSFYSDTAVKHYKNRLGEDVTKIVKKKGARKQVLSCQNGRVTEEVHVPLKRWQRILERFGFGAKKENSHIISSNPRDFDRFCD